MIKDYEQNDNIDRKLLQEYKCFMNNEEESNFFHITDNENSILKDNLVTITNEIIDIVDKKNKDYGNSFTKSVDEFGDVIYVIRLDDKINRLKSLVKSDKANVVEESLRDTVLDIVGYGLLILNDIDSKAVDKLEYSEVE